MNIDDFDINKIDTGTGDKMDRVFARQEELALKYTTIEKKNGFQFPEEMPLDLNDGLSQLRLKDFAWRITEEMGEALEAFRTHSNLDQHYDEELADAFHFLIEFTLLAGVDPTVYEGMDKLEYIFNVARTSKKREYAYLARAVGEFVEALAVTCNCLKNKPWKTTQMITDVDYFTEKLRVTWLKFAELCWKSGIDSNKLFELYFRKAAVNSFRQRSNY